MKKPFIIGIIALTALIVVVVAKRPSAALPSPMPNGGSAVLVIASPSYDFGTISMSKGKVDREFTVTNTGTRAVKLGKLYTSCMCTAVTLTVGDKHYGPFSMVGMGYVAPVDDMLQPGQSATLTTTFDPNAHGPAGVGHIEREVTLENDGGAPAIVSFKADVMP